MGARLDTRVLGCVLDRACIGRRCIALDAGAKAQALGTALCAVAAHAHRLLDEFLPGPLHAQVLSGLASTRRFELLFMFLDKPQLVRARWHWRTRSICVFRRLLAAWQARIARLFGVLHASGAEV